MAVCLIISLPRRTVSQWFPSSLLALCRCVANAVAETVTVKKVMLVMKQYVLKEITVKKFLYPPSDSVVGQRSFWNWMMLNRENTAKNEGYVFVVLLKH